METDELLSEGERAAEAVYVAARLDKIDARQFGAIASRLEAFDEVAGAYLRWLCHRRPPVPISIEPQTVPHPPRRHDLHEARLADAIRARVTHALYSVRLHPWGWIGRVLSRVRVAVIMWMYGVRRAEPKGKPVDVYQLPRLRPRAR